MHLVRKDIPQLFELLLCIPWAFSQSSKLQLLIPALTLDGTSLR